MEESKVHSYGNFFSLPIYPGRHGLGSAFEPYGERSVLSERKPFITVHLVRQAVSSVQFQCCGTQTKYKKREAVKPYPFRPHRAGSCWACVTNACFTWRTETPQSVREPLCYRSLLSLSLPLAISISSALLPHLLSFFVFASFFLF